MMNFGLLWGDQNEMLLFVWQISVICSLTHDITMAHFDMLIGADGSEKRFGEC